MTFSPVWTLDGREIIFSSGPYLSPNLFRIAASGSGKPQRLASIGEDGSEPAISHRAQRLVYTRELIDVNIWRVEVPGPHGKISSPMKLISSTRFDGDAQFSPDGKRIAFNSDRTGSDEIWMCDSDGSNAVQLTSLGIGNSCEVRAGLRMVSELLLPGTWRDSGRSTSPASTEASQNASPVVQPPMVSPSWSRDGKWIYFASDRSGEYQVWKMPAGGGEAVQLTRKGGY